MRPAFLISGAATCLVLVACSQGSGTASVRVDPPAVSTVAASAPDADWLTFDLNPQRTGVSTARTGITAANVARLRRRDVGLPGTVDSSPVQLHGVSVGGRRRDVVILTTSYGITVAIDPANGRRLWTYTPGATSRIAGSSQITNVTPVVSADRRFVYVASPDGLIHKLFTRSGAQVRGRWPVRVTADPTREKLASALTLTGRTLYVPTDGYIGDQGSYEGHIVTIDTRTGRLTHVFNSLCSDIRTLIDPPARCTHHDSAIWGRAGVVVEPGGARILAATGNGDFDGRRNWGDSVLQLSPTLRLLHNWTPGEQASLNSSDTDVGSTSPVLLPVFGGRHLAVQGGKSGIFWLLDLNRLNGTRGGASPRTGGELQRIAQPGRAQLFSAPLAVRLRGRVLMIAADGSGTAAYVLENPAHPRLRVAWEDSAAGTSPVIAGGLLYVYDEQGGRLNVRDPATGRLLAALPAGTGHWNSPIVAGGRVILPVGNANDHATSGQLQIFHLPSR